MCSVDFYHFILNKNSLKAFYHFILKILKNMIFLKKHAGFARTLKIFFDFNVAHLKMTYRFLGVTNITYIVINHFSNTEKTCSKNFGTIAAMWHTFLFSIIFGKMEILQQFRPSNFYSIFVAS